VKKMRVYEAARFFNISSAAMLEVIRSLDIPVKSHMSVIGEDVVEAIKKKFEKEKEAAKIEDARKREKRAHTKLVRRREKPRAAVKPAERKPRPRPPRKPRRKVDEKAVRESVRKTLAIIGGRKKGHRRRRRLEEERAGKEQQKLIRASEFLTVSELAAELSVSPSEVLATCLRLGLLVNINSRLDGTSILAVADEFGYSVELLSEFGEEQEPEVEDGKIEPRAPVVTIMGHVDHGKTRLLDYIRKTNVIAGEAGGITQHIGAYTVMVQGKKVTFLDTPGHEAFTAMRARGAQVTDIVVLVVAADDRVMPQTLEAIDHARAAEVPIIVAINKIDLPAANPELVRKELADAGLTPEEWGGDTICIEISAKTGEGIDRLLEMILLVAEMMELGAPLKRKARGTVIESKIEPGRGIVGTVLVESGTLRVGDPFVAGIRHGKVRALVNERGQRVKHAGTSEPVEVLGWSGPPLAGDSFRVVADEREARSLASRREQMKRAHDQTLARRISLQDLRARIDMGEVSELRLVIKGDVAGSVEALADSLGKVESGEVKLKIIRQAVGNITESDVLLAAASDAIVIGFQVEPEPRVRELASREKVDLRTYKVIYEAVRDMKDAMGGLLKPEQREMPLGEAEVREVFSLSRAGKVAGVYVVSGVARRNANARLKRNGEVLYEGKVSSLKRFKEDVREVSAGFECGVGLEGFDDVQEKDIIEFYTIEEFSRTID